MFVTLEKIFENEPKLTPDSFRVRYLNPPDPIKKKVDKGELSMSHASEIVNFPPSGYPVIRSRVISLIHTVYAIFLSLSSFLHYEKMRFNQTKELILRTLHKKGEMTALELAETLNRDKRTIGSLLLHYEKQGLLNRRDKPYLWYLTQKGMNRLALRKKKG